MGTLLPIACGSLAVLFAGDALAHHAYGEYDVNKEVTIRGIVKRFQWTSPHIWVELMARDPRGKEADWPIEGAGPLVLRQSGWSRDCIKPGDRIEMVIHPRKDGSSGGSLVTALIHGRYIGARPA